MLANVILFQVGWFACVLGGAHDRPWFGTSIALAIVAWHVARAVRPRDELILILISAGVGAVFDSVLVALGWAVVTPSLVWLLRRFDGVAPLVDPKAEPQPRHA